MKKQSKIFPYAGDEQQTASSSTTKMIPSVLSIAGSDSSGGAGIQADLKTISAMNCYGATVITAITAQNTLGVQEVFALAENAIEAQLVSILSDIRCNAVKTGMLYSEGIINKVTELLMHYKARNIVIDPVIYSKNNALLLQKNAINALVKNLFPISTVITPNIPEAEFILQQKITNFSEMEQAAFSLLHYGMKAVIIKGGHLHNQKESNDVLVCLNEKKERVTKWFCNKRILTPHTHGTGCTFSAALASSLALGLDLATATAQAKNFVSRAIEVGNERRIGQGISPVWPTALK